MRRVRGLNGEGRNGRGVLALWSTGTKEGGEKQGGLSRVVDKNWEKKKKRNIKSASEDIV